MAYTNLENVRTELRDRTLIVTIDRPNALNALNAVTVGEIDRVFAEAAEDESVFAVVLTGGGEKAFVAGADINELATMTPITGKRVSERGQSVLDRIEQFPKPVIAAINGFALGGGCEIALACHIRIASDNAKIGLPEVGLGIIPGYGGTQRLPRLIGRGRALELICTGRPIPAVEAERIGLVNRVVPQAELLDAALALVAEMMKNSPLAIRGALEAVTHGVEMPQNEGQVLEATIFAVLCASEDMKEGMSAFVEKRKEKRFTGR